MAWRVEFDEESRVFRTIFSGMVTDEDALESARARFRHPSFPEARVFYTDHSGIEGLEVTSEGALRLAELIREAAERNPDLRCVSILPSPGQYGMGRLFQAYAPDSETGWKTYIARSREEASAWLARVLAGDEPPSSTPDPPEDDS